jgi:hypothetical protein
LIRRSGGSTEAADQWMHSFRRAAKHSGQ